MKELKFHRFLKWDEIYDIINKYKNEYVIIKLPNSIYNSPKMKYKIEYLKKHHIVVECDNEKRGRKKKIDNDKKYKILKMYREGYSLIDISRILEIPKSTIFMSLNNELNIIKKDIKIEELNNILYEYKEYLIKEGIYTQSLDYLFAELKIYIKNEDINSAYKVLNNIKKEVKKLRN